MEFFIKSCHLDIEKTDCIIIGIFNTGELSIAANYLDKRSNDYISSLLKLGDIQGKLGQTLLLYNVPNILSKRILLVGCGEKAQLERIKFKKIIRKSVYVLKKVNVKKIIFALGELVMQDTKNSIYWITRIIVCSIKEFLNTNIKMNSVNKNLNIHLITFNLFKKNDFHAANFGLKDGLAISYGVMSAKNISNLPPNICHPLYLSEQSKKLSQKYKNNITVEVIDIDQMKSLGMNAYIAVGDGSKNKPFMSIIKYSGDNLINEKVIVLVGKGMTFDSGGISIKSANYMHEMKYDMCGAASVYGALIAAAELKLPLTIIGVLAGCENMLGGNSFRPGDVLTTMSGKTVEILNTDAEGRLVLCDVLTYLERFSPDIVIDIATLTGACVIALGDSASGFFSNNEKLFDEFSKAAKETNDKIWRLPLFPEYYKELTSRIADFSNVGKGKAGAITAACFLSNFTKNYAWAHLDIAGTAWKSGQNEEATGRPVELLCQFLLNQSKSVDYEKNDK